jgi:predicted lactoylglutathione lyase
VVPAATDKPQKQGSRQTMDMKLEVVLVPVSDVDRAKEFYEMAGFRLDADFPSVRATGSCS